MITQSGCFGGESPEYDTIDDLDEARSAVEEIVATAAPSAEQPSATESVLQATKMLFGLANRITLLTWAVVAIVVYLILKEVK